MSEYFRPNLWPNTPDILAVCAFRRRAAGIHDSGSPGRDAFALYGIYSGYELCENEALPAARSISILKNIKQGARLECARKYQGLDRATKQNPKGKPRLSALHELAVPRRRERCHSVLQQE